MKPFKKITCKGLESRTAVTKFDTGLPPQGRIKYSACNEASDMPFISFLIEAFNV
jgi:hypothetical protein